MTPYERALLLEIARMLIAKDAHTDVDDPIAVLARAVLEEHK